MTPKRADKYRRGKLNLANVKFTPLKFSPAKPAAPKLGVKF
ncbi:hypothetical protein CAMRE0001_0011 [Campylobacter rectus RM3267]|uniref:Uncharacterized protein n=1 Tax=Campylobacter rectus RM3267 TaxID=553218 RepID=B9D3F7_CAMRE|nr:hypothetical protein CAMRE0001_0011 [Campylobacter rectus RM3267]